MKALVLKENAKLSWEEHELRKVDGWYRLRIASAGICGSDIGRGFSNGAYHYPLVMGHEFSAVVEETPHGGKFAPGTLVAVYPLLPCGECEPCKKGWIQLCEKYDYFGSRRDGAFAEELYAPESHLLAVPSDVTADDAAMCEPAAVAYHSVFSHPVNSGASALVIGGGPIGLLAAQWLRIRGATATVADIDPAKLAFAAKLGFRSVNSRELNGEQFQYVVEACGVATTRSLAIDSCARRGHIFFIGNPSDDWTLPKKLFSSILRKELSFNGSWNSVPFPDWQEVLAHAGKDLLLKPLVTDRVPLCKGADAFTRIVNHSAFHCKTLLVNE